MNKYIRLFFIKISFLLISINCFSQSDHKLVVDVSKTTATIQPTMWGIFFEDINLAADGGLYAELVKNRSFEFAQPLMGWKEQKQNGGSVLILNRSNENAANPRFARITVKGSKPFVITNEGFRGMGIREGNSYIFSIWAKNNAIAQGKVTVNVTDSSGNKIGETSFIIDSKNWKKYNLSFQATATVLKAKMNLQLENPGIYDIDMVSLFPKDTWKERPGGLRKDLVQMLADIKPGFIRFPGGCIVEGRDLTNRYQWKKTVGNVEDRQLIVNRWNMEFASRSTPDYFQSFGLGFYEYFLLAEDIGASPLPILNCGMACQFNSAEAVTLDAIQPYIQDAIDLVEFANGSVQTKWGKLRASMGHPKPFNLTMMGVGNENWGPQYIERLAVFTKAVRAKCPGIKFVNSSGTDPSGERFDFLNGELRKMNADLIDEHYYRPPEWFLQNAKRYDHYDRGSSKVFAGEYAAHGPGNGENKSTWLCAMSEAAFMTGLERNADVVSMASYAPLFAYVDGWQWAPDLIWFDNLHSYGTPEYYVQQLFSNNKGDVVVPITSNDSVLAGTDSLYASATVDKKANELIIKIVNASRQEDVHQLDIKGVGLKENKVSVITMNGALTIRNSLENPTLIAPVSSMMEMDKDKLRISLPPYSFKVIRVKLM